VVAAHKEVDAVIANEVDEPVLLCDATRPDVRAHVAQRFRFAYSAKGVAHDGFDQVKHSERDPAVRFNPEPEIFAELVLKCG